MEEKKFQLDAKVEGKNYNFTCNADSPIVHVKEVLVKFLHYACQLEDQALAQQLESKEPQKEEIPQEV